MELSVLAAKILAIIYMAIGISVLFGQLNARKTIKSLEDSPGLTFISGLFMIVVGALLIQYHNIWVKDWTVLVTIVGWALLIKGILFLAIPKLFLSMSGKFARTEKWMGIIVIAIALLFGYFGFIA